MKIAVSFIKSKHYEKETVDLINETSADYLHVDIMDGLFVNNKNYDFDDIKMIVKNNHKPLDIHLMCENPLDYIKDYIKLNPESITFHIEAVHKPLSLINILHDNNIKCGLAINPDTSINEILPYLSSIDKVLVMSVYPGEGGQTFIENTLDKISRLAEFKGDFLVEVDGGINDETIKKLENVDIVVSGSYVCMSDDYEKQILSLKNIGV